MIEFVNAKINLGLNVVRRREDGYHELETIFLPVGLENGMPQQPEPFDDILEITFDRGSVSGCRFQFIGNKIDCDPRKNLVVKAASMIIKNYMEKVEDMSEFGMFEITLDKHIPDGAGLGGGSADAAFTLKMLNQIFGKKFNQEELKRMALKLGADCPFFIENRPCFAEGIGEKLTPIELDLSGKNLLIIKPDIHISTADAFAGIEPRRPDFDLRYISYLPISEWKGRVVNDFEKTVFEKHPELKQIKESLYDAGAVYASMSGSGSSVYGIFEDREVANSERNRVESTYQGVWLFGL